MRLVFSIALLTAALLPADSFEPKLFHEMKWRSIGPYRGGRTKAAVGIASQPSVFYIGAVNGGVWRTNDYGRTWNPLFDDQPTGSIGAIAIAPSDTKIIYVGSGEGLQRPDLSTGDGIYRSVDSGKTWVHLGLRDGQQIPRILVDPRNADHIFVAVLGHPYGPNTERGVFESTDGGQSFRKSLYKDENTGASDLEFDPTNPDILYACLWEARQGPWENAAWSGTGGGMFKSTDGGKSWHPLTRGLGPDGVVQADIAVSRSNRSRLYASVATRTGTALYRSDDAGENWSRATTDTRPAQRIGGGDLPVLEVDPRNPDILYSASVVTWKSTDGGKSWTGIRGAPGGDDYQRLWINPDHPEIILNASDQGAIVTVNGGETWSSWFNQPTSQMYHAAADNAYPYRVCSGQQESGSACVSSRGSDGEITFREWHPVGVEEYGFVAPDPLNPDLVYGGKVTRYNRATGQVETVGPKPLRSADFRTLRTAPLLFSPADPRTLYFAANTLWKTRDGGNTWAQISPDLSRKTWDAPANIGKYKADPSAQPSQRGVIYAVGPSPLNVNRIWVGTDDGLIHTTADGGLHWKDVTPPQLTAFMKVAILDAGHFDQGTAYAAINTLRLDDMRPHIFRTHDSGAHWQEVVNGIPDGASVDVVREDPKRKGLLYAGTERETFVSFDDGDHWQSLRLNMPATSIRDLIVKDDDLVVATHGRGFWILDDVTPLRQMTQSIADSPAYLLKPQLATRVRWDMNTDTPIPPDEPAGQNPPDGAVIDFYLGTSVSGAVTLDITDAAGKPVRHYASTELLEPVDPQLAVPQYWVRFAKALPGDPGLHRFLWDLHYQPLPRGRPAYPMQAVLHDTAPAPNSPWVLPGVYTVKLTANGKTYTQPLTVRMDPRVKAGTGVTQRFLLSKQLYDDQLKTMADVAQLRALRRELRDAREKATGAAALAVEAFEKKAGQLEGAATGGRGGGGRGAGPGPDTLSSVSAGLGTLLQTVQNADTTPTGPLQRAVADRRAALAKLRQSWTVLKTRDLIALNAQLKAANLTEIKLESAEAAAIGDDDDDDDDIG